MPVKVLIADAHALLADALARCLRTSSDLHVLGTLPRNALELLDEVAASRPEVALVDYWLGGLTGPELTRAVLVESPRTCVINMSAFHGPAQIADALHAGAAGWLSKSVSVGDVVDAVRRVYRGDRPLVRSDGTRAQGPVPGTVLPLSPRELEVLRLLAEGREVPEIADRLSISRATVRTHIQRALEKTGTRSRIAAVAVVRAHGLVR